ncbi:MAG: ADP-ribosylglycohydrolase family protein [Atopobiaceae bacterium]|nr:ADP-ribosylglycohydrolase family protein [Atopobiaceae bacterium]
MQTKTIGRLHDAVWGAAVGDALGVPYEFKERGSFECTGMVGYGTHHQPAGTWSDDTALMLATCDSIKQCGRIDTTDMLERFRSWYNQGGYTPDGKVFDVGNATAEALYTGEGLTGEWSNGNGSLMRIAAFPWWRGAAWTASACMRTRRMCQTGSATSRSPCFAKGCAEGSFSLPGIHMAVVVSHHGWQPRSCYHTKGISGQHKGIFPCSRSYLSNVTATARSCTATTSSTRRSVCT